MRLGILLLVAGGSSRMGTQKLLLPWGESTVVGGALEAALAAGAAQVIIVTGCDAARVEEACRSVCVSRTVQFVFNPDWASGTRPFGRGSAPWIPRLTASSWPSGIWEAANGGACV
jgi:molybdenum cofactor cytidylyltransferase